MKCDIYHPFPSPYPTTFPITLLHCCYQLMCFFFFDKALSSVRAGHMCLGMGPSAYGKPTNGHSL